MNALQLEDFSDDGRPYVALALARALIQSGHPADALDRLDTLSAAEWLGAPQHVRAAALRWRARALDAQSRAVEAGRIRLQLQSFSNDPQRHLAAIDVALEQNLDWTTPMRELLVSEAGSDVEYALRGLEDHGYRGLGDASVVRRVVDEFRY